MTGAVSLFDLNPSLDRPGAADRFARDGRVQVPDFLTPAAAQTVLRILSRETPWGIAWQAGTDGPHRLRRQEFANLSPAVKQGTADKIARAMRGGDYAFNYGQYAMLNAYLEGWNEHQGLDFLMEHINADPMLDMARAVTGIPELRKADAQATLYGPSHFLAVHDDSHIAEGRRVAYVMNFCSEEWRPEWGGYLLFHDDAGDVVAGFRPQFNVLNMFRVPQKHSVSYVPPFAPVARFAITGWFRDR